LRPAPTSAARCFESASRALSPVVAAANGCMLRVCSRSSQRSGLSTLACDAMNRSRAEIDARAAALLPHSYARVVATLALGAAPPAKACAARNWRGALARRAA
jgi:hypothetical protein